MADRTIPQRELRNNVAAVLREAELGTEFTITVRGRPVARMGPAADTNRRQVELPGHVLRALLAQTPVDPGYAADLTELRELEDPVSGPSADE
jgi:prevent-host-death family protein